MEVLRRAQDDDVSADQSETECARSAEAICRNNALTAAGRRSDDAEYLRGEIQDLRDRITVFERGRSDLETRLTRIEEKPLKASQVMFSAPAFVTACAMIAAIIGGSYWVNGGARAEQHDIKMLIEERTKTQDKTNTELHDAIQSVQRELKATEDRLRGEIRMSEYAKKQGLPKP